MKSKANSHKDLLTDFSLARGSRNAKWFFKEENHNNDDNDDDDKEEKLFLKIIEHKFS